MVSSSQNEFVKGRQVLDAMLMENKVVDSRRKKRESRISCQLDLEGIDLICLSAHVRLIFLHLTSEPHRFCLCSCQSEDSLIDLKTYS